MRSAATRSGVGAMQLEIEHITKSYRNGWLRRPGRMVLEDIALVVAPGQSVGVVGASGSGKTTLGLIISGIMRPDSGSVRWGAIDLWTAPVKVRKVLVRKLQMVFQHPESTFDPRWTMAQSLSEPYVLRGVRPSPRQLRAMLEQVELDESMLARRPDRLSGGELQRMTIARIMALEPAVVVLDEPTAMLDVLTQARIMRLLTDIQHRTGVSYVLISHDAALVRRFCRAIHRLEQGRLIVD